MRKIRHRTLKCAAWFVLRVLVLPLGEGEGISAARYVAVMKDCASRVSPLTLILSHKGRGKKTGRLHPNLPRLGRERDFLRNPVVGDGDSGAADQTDSSTASEYGLRSE